MKKSILSLSILLGLFLSVIFTSCMNDDDDDLPPDVLTGTTFINRSGPIVLSGTIITKIEFLENGKYSLSESSEGKYGFTTRKSGTYKLVSANSDIIHPDEDYQSYIDYCIFFDNDNENCYNLDGPDYDKIYWSLPEGTNDGIFYKL